MIEYIQGLLTSLSPANAVIDIQGIGYSINISLFSYEKIQSLVNKPIKLLIHFIVREDAQLLYGFFDNEERSLFRHLISINGVGPNTARQILSSLPPMEIKGAIAKGDQDFLKSIKGIGPKTAQRLIIELQEIILKEKPDLNFISSQHNKEAQEALNAMIALGFSKQVAEKSIKSVIDSTQESMTVESIIKKALKDMR